MRLFHRKERMKPDYHALDIVKELDEFYSHPTAALFPRVAYSQEPCPKKPGHRHVMTWTPSYRLECKKDGDS